MDLGLKGAKAVISGGSKGIGLEVARELLKEGVQVSIAARTKATVDSAVAELSKLGEVHGDTCDVSDYDATVAWMQKAAEQMGGIDIVVHNATASGLPDGGPSSWQSNFGIDVMGMVGMSEGALPFLEQSERASLIQIASITGIEHHDVPISPSYGAMKAASIRHMAQRAQQWGSKGIRANTVAPGPIYIEGGAWNNIKDNATALYERDRDWHPSKRMGTPEEVARVVAFLASPAASWVNGTTVRVDGAFTRSVNF
ncbi:MAG: 3-oxoacyl-[acyl-carrier protein] reductase [Candidatus Azotimanducaceae bacterium]|jgi:3-oxoacyl-[acyl-carrier protein] reductase